MLVNWTQPKYVFIVYSKTDLRKGIDGLAAVVAENYDLDLFDDFLRPRISPRLVKSSTTSSSTGRSVISGLFTFYDFPEAIHSTIYTTNVIESFNKQLKRQIDKKEQFPNEDALDRFVMTQVATYNDQNVSRIRRTRTGFTSCKDTLDAMF